MTWPLDNQHSIETVLTLRSSKKNEHSQYDVAHNPEGKQHTDAEGRSYCVPHLFGLACRMKSTNVGETADNPDDHQNIEANKQQLEYLAKQTASGLAQPRAAVRTLHGLIAHLPTTLPARNQAHLSFPQRQSKANDRTIIAAQPRVKLGEAA